jgi:4'-phosphopantetheinyl transferase
MIILNQKDIRWSSFRLAAAKVHIWQASLLQPEDVVQQLQASLSEEERQRANRFRSPEHRRAFILGRGVLRDLLYRYTGIEPGQIRFKYNLAGKPFLASEEDAPEIHFNVSHAGQLVLFAFSWDCPVGIDVECIRPMEEMDQVAERSFSAQEYRKFQRIREPARLKAFYHCWTRKEALVKATGEGLSFPLSDIEVSFEPDEPVELLSIHGSPERAGHWTMHDLKAQDGYAAALVVAGKDHSLSHKQWTGPFFTGQKHESECRLPVRTL